MPLEIMKHTPRLLRLLALIAIVSFPMGCAGQDAKAPSKRELATEERGQWLGRGISYGPYRDGQKPGGKMPTAKQILEDLRIIAKHWKIIRTYGAAESEATLKVIAKHDVPLRVMIGAWLAPEAHYDESGKVKERLEDNRRANAEQVQGVIALANRYRRQVMAVSVGNETQVFWSPHKMRLATLIDHVRAVRKGVKVPVTVADDFNFWNKPESQKLARHLDFIVTHIHPHWAGTSLDDSMPWTKKIWAEVAKHHPTHTIVIGEAGWATKQSFQGEQGKLIKGKAGEAEQKVYHDAFCKWTAEKRIVSFYFEAFDESWKGGDHPDEVEKHWGLYKADRTPKAAMRKNGR